MLLRERMETFEKRIFLKTSNTCYVNIFNHFLPILLLSFYKIYNFTKIASSLQNYFDITFKYN